MNSINKILSSIILSTVLILTFTSNRFADTYNINNGDATITEDDQSITLTIRQGNKVINTSKFPGKYKEIKFFKNGRLMIVTTPRGETRILVGRMTDGEYIIADN